MQFFLLSFSILANRMRMLSLFLSLSSFSVAACGICATLVLCIKLELMKMQMHLQVRWFILEGFEVQPVLIMNVVSKDRWLDALELVGFAYREVAHICIYRESIFLEGFVFLIEILCWIVGMVNCISGIRHMKWQSLQYKY